MTAKIVIEGETYDEIMRALSPRMYEIRTTFTKPNITPEELKREMAQVGLQPDLAPEDYGRALDAVRAQEKREAVIDPQIEGLQSRLNALATKYAAIRVELDNAQGALLHKNEELLESAAADFQSTLGPRIKELEDALKRSDALVENLQAALLHKNDELLSTSLVEKQNVKLVALLHACSGFVYRAKVGAKAHEQDPIDAKALWSELNEVIPCSVPSNHAPAVAPENEPDPDIAGPPREPDTMVVAGIEVDLNDEGITPFDGPGGISDEEREAAEERAAIVETEKAEEAATVKSGDGEILAGIDAEVWDSRKVRDIVMAFAHAGVKDEGEILRLCLLNKDASKALNGKTDEAVIERVKTTIAQLDPWDLPK